MIREGPAASLRTRSDETLAWASGGRKFALPVPFSSRLPPPLTARRARVDGGLCPATSPSPARAPMLPYGLKVVWFALSLSGLLSSWVALPAFTKSIARGIWLPIVYGGVNTVLQGVFCLGLIWRMDPFLMPKAFCIAQTSLMQLCWSCLAGCCLIASLSNAADAFRGRPSGRLLHSLSGRSCHVVLVAIFPVVVFAVQLALLLRLDAVRPVDGLNCDASSPTWVRLVGYSGTSLLLAAPSIILSLMTIFHILCPPQAQSTTHATARTVYSHDALTSLPTRRSRRRESRYLGQRLDSLNYAMMEPPIATHSALDLPKTLISQDCSEGPYPPISPGRAPSQAKHSKFHLPFSNPAILSTEVASVPSSPQPSLRSSRESPVHEVERSRRSSYRSAPSPIIFSPPPRTDNRVLEPTVVNISPSPVPPPFEVDEKDDGSITEVHHDADGDNAAAGTLRWTHAGEIDTLKKDRELEYGGIDDDACDEPVFATFPRIRRSPSGQPPWLDDTPATPPTPLRAVSFALVLGAVLVVCAVTSLIDIFAHQRPPMPFGTQHAALVLVAWAPALFIGTVSLMDRLELVLSFVQPRPSLGFCRR